MLSSLEDSGIIIFSSSNDWGTTPSNTPQPNRRNRKQTVNPVFEEYRKLTRDTFWIEFFDKAKVNNFPKNYSFIDGVINHRVRNKYTSFNTDPVNVDNFEKMKVYLFSTGGIESPIDSSIRSKKIFTLKVEELPFRKIKSVPAKLKIALSNYTTKMAKKYNLGITDIGVLEGVVRVAIIAEHIGEDDVVLRHNLIEEIKNVHFNEVERTVTIVHSVSKKNKKNVDTEEYSRLTYSLGEKRDGDAVVFTPKKSILEQWAAFVQRIGEKKNFSSKEKKGG